MASGTIERRGMHVVCSETERTIANLSSSAGDIKREEKGFFAPLHLITHSATLIPVYFPKKKPTL
jgi:hypothetical protein